MIYHIVSKSDWQNAEASDTYRGDTLDTEGFIHCSTMVQVANTGSRYYSGRTDLLILSIDPAQLSAEVKYEDSGKGELFPHVYGPIENEAVLAVTAFPPQPDGSFELPEGLGE